MEEFESRRLLAVDLLAELVPVAESSYPSHLVAVGDQVYFSASQLTGKPEVWVTDGTAPGTRPLGISGDLGATTVHEGDLYFVAGETLYVSEGLTETPVALTDAFQQVQTNKLLSYRGDVYFAGQDTDIDRAPTQPGHDLMRTSGVPSEARYVRPTSEGDAQDFAQLIDIWNDQIFYLTEASTSGANANSSDGTFQGTQALEISVRRMQVELALGDLLIGELFRELEIRDRATGFGFRFGDTIDPRDLTPVDRGNSTSVNLYFVSDRFTPREIVGQVWFTDGENARRIDAVVPDLLHATELEWFADRLWIATSDSLWTLTPGEDPLNPIESEFTLQQTFSAEGGPQNLSVLDDNLYFTAESDSGRSIWRVPADSPSPELVVAAQGIVDASSFMQLDELLLFSGSHPDVGYELWSWNGNSGEIQLLADINQGLRAPEPSDIVEIFEFNDLVLFTLDDGRHGSELWRSDGTVDGTYLVRDIFPGPPGSGIVGLVEFQNAVYFTANDGLHGTELWRTDGTSENTHLVVDLAGGRAASDPTLLTPYGDKLFFFANDAVHGNEIWETDGTASGTRMVGGERSGEEGWQPSLFTAMDDGLAFTVDGTLWTVDLSRPELPYASMDLPRTPIQLFAAGDEVVFSDGRDLYEFDEFLNSFSSIYRLENAGPIHQWDDGNLLLASRDQVIIYDPRRQAERIIAELSPASFYAIGQTVFIWQWNRGATYDLVYYQPGFTAARLLLDDVRRASAESFAGRFELVYDISRDGKTEVWRVDESLQPTLIAEFDDVPQQIATLSEYTVLTVKADDRQKLRSVPRATDAPAIQVETIGDVDELFAAIQSGNFDTRFDVDANQRIDNVDVDIIFDSWLETSQADFNLDGNVDFRDFLSLSGNFGRSNAQWSEGDADGNGFISFEDFLILSRDFGN